MTACDRFENEGLPRFLAGEPLDEHFETCSDCRAARTSYQAIVLALGQAREAYLPPPDWEARVWARIHQNQSRLARPRWGIFAGWATATAGAVAVAVVAAGSLGGVQALELDQPIIARGNGPTVRGAPGTDGEVVSAAPGNVLHLSAKVPRKYQASDFRVYRGSDELFFQCATSPACIRSRDTLKAEVTLDKPGIYRTVLIASEKELPPATGNLDADYAAGLRAGAGKAKLSQPIEVL